MPFPRHLLAIALAILGLGLQPPPGHGQPASDSPGPSPATAVEPGPRHEPRPEPAAARTPSAAPGATIAPVSGPAPARRRPPTPLAAELARLREQEQTELQRLSRELERETRPSERFALQRRVQSVKISGEVAMLRAQLEHARRQGRGETVRALQASIDALLAPPAPGTPQARPAEDPLEASPGR
jgi:hypothetical protein